MCGGQDLSSWKCEYRFCCWADEIVLGGLIVVGENSNDELSSSERDGGRTIAVC